MTNKLKNIYTHALDNIIKRHIGTKSNTIFVLAGITPYIYLENYADKITDQTTFDKEGNLDLYSPAWFGSVFPKLMSATTYQILSHQQYASINEYLNEDFFKERIVVVYDNLRSLYPINKEEYIEKADTNGTEKRPEGMPVYQAEQLKVGEDYFYSLKHFNDDLKKESLFSIKKGLTSADIVLPDSYVLDVISDPYGIDVLVNKCLDNEIFSQNVFVKVSGKNVLNKATWNTLQELNHLLSRFGGGIFLQNEETIQRDYKPSEESLSLLKQYWGDNAEFRDIQVYENPEIDNKIIPVSQGLLVDTIINEYKKGCDGVQPRDIFITAPTGAGKSLIFQLPAFYAASKGDVTIVVSPLKALMTDQVEILRSERKYDKVEFINSDLTLIDRDKIIDECKRGEVDILYLSPELLLSYDIHYFIGERKLGLLIVDEAHLITTWGRDFRVDYWFLGNHINKIRKYNNYLFPLVALTATAVYGGVNDMVFDSINSLNMYDPHKFIGNVRRDNIEFVIDTHDDYSTGGYDQNKETETVNFIKGIQELDMKGIVYAPYTRQINRLKDKCDEINTNIAVAFHGGMLADEQKFAYQAFKSNTCKIMIATKAFGMGVDIPDIQVVYHHAPSGLLPDYIQEIGRAARKKQIQGFAALTFSKSDLRYSKQLFGISSLKTFQLKEVLRKIIRCFNSNGKKRNMLVAANDFAYIFDSAEEVDQKVATALMMIEKDYLIKTRFNVLIARPKKLFTKVYARTTQVGLDRLLEKYGECFKEIPHLSGTYHTLELNLDEIWSKHFSDRSFPQIKSEFYKQRFLIEEGIELTPQIRVTINIEKAYREVLSEVKNMLNAFSVSFAQFKFRGAFFTYKEFVAELEQNISTKYDTEKIASFVLGTYSGYLQNPHALEGDSFLQQRHHGTTMNYQVFSTNYSAKFTQLIKILSNLFDGKERQSADRYLSINEVPLKNHIRLGSLLELMELGSFETTGGDDPKIFLRLNDPRRIEKDSTSEKYSNFILESVKNRHKVSCALFEHFFTNYFSNENRWNMIEDFFLGMSNDELFEKYPGKMVNHIDILQYLKENKSYIPLGSDSMESANNTHKTLFLPKRQSFYNRDNMLTIGHQTKPIKKWLTDDPVALHRTIEEYEIVIEKDDFKVLSNKLRLHHFEYYRDFMRLKVFIDFPGYTTPVQAAIPYSTDPVKFYKWWRKHTEEVTMNLSEKLKLFLAVERESPTALIKAHRALIKK